MRAFNFKARSIGDEKYLTYTMGEDCDLDEDVLDYCEENNLKQLVEIIYEEDDDYDYLTYDITGRTSLDAYISNEIKCEAVISILRNISLELIDLKEQNIQLAYLLLNKNFVYVDEDSYEVSFICLPVESKAAVAAEFKSFVRQLLANMKYDVDEDLNYVGKLLTYINGDSFNLRGLIGLCEALLEEEGISFDENDSIDAEGGVEVVDTEEADVSEMNNFMADMAGADEEPLPEIGDDEVDEEEEIADDDDGQDELESIVPESMSAQATTEEEVDEEEPEVEAEPEPQPKPESAKPERTFNTSTLRTAGDRKEMDVDLVKSRIKEIVANGPGSKQTTDEPIKSLAELDDFLGGKPPVIKKNVVKVNRAALIQNLAEQESEMDEAEEQEQIEEVSAGAETEETAEVVEETTETEETPKSNSVLSKTIPETAKTNTLTAIPQAIPYLIRVNTEERVMLDRTVFRIGKGGRGVDYSVRGNSAISRHHAVILQKDGVCYIKDDKSTNHTYVNNKMVEEGVEEILTHDSIITLGDEDFLFKVR